MKLIVPLRRADYLRLERAARNEYRDPQAQAAYLIQRALDALDASARNAAIGPERVAGQPETAR